MDKFKNDDDSGRYKISKVEIDISKFEQEPDCECLPLIATRNLVLFPGVTVTFELSREASLRVARAANESGKPVGIVCQNDPAQENPKIPSGLFKYGVFADVLNIFESEEDSAPMAIVRARGRFRIMGQAKAEESPDYPAARVKPSPEMAQDMDDNAYTTLLGVIKDTAIDSLKASGAPQHLLQTVSSNDASADMVNFLCTNLPFENAVKGRLLSSNSAYGRASAMFGELCVFRERLQLTQEVVERARKKMDENQRTAFLQTQMETIREALHEDERDETDELADKADKAGLPKKVMDLFNKELEKLRRFNPTTPDYSIQYTYLDTLVSLPWKKFTKTKPTVREAKEVLEADHYGLEKVKERILEQLAMMMHRPDGRSPIICLVGPPGVGKTSIGKSIASALGRKYERVSFGGLHDEAEIRGHRRTYIGAMPGRIIDAIKRVGVSNPVLVLDEIDKIGNDYKGDPSAALLEVLDPEQNCHFHDNYVDVDFDLSHVLFIATANTLSTIPRPLLDRMEIIDISGYLVEEKIEIARRHLIPRMEREYDIEFAISDDALMQLISEYTSESGVRQLEKRLNAIGRKQVLAQMENRDFPKPVAASDLYSMLGLPPYLKDSYEGNDLAGVVVGLAWTEVGGEILLAETSLSPAKDGRLTVTGNLGDVMKESASIAYQWVKSHATTLSIDPSLFERYNVHVHFPEGAVPKDGPSAGITIATSLVSAMTQKRVAERTAMTGEISLRGRVLPVGGIREKVLAAKRAGITDIILCERNRRDIDDMPEPYRQGLSFHFVDTVDQVMDLAITSIPAANARPL